MKKTIISILTLSVISVMMASNTSALTYSGDVNVNFTFNTSLTVSLSSADIVINDLVPGTSDDSNIVDINVVTNNINGYYLTSTVGSSSNTTTNLTHSNNINTFASLSPSDSVVDTASFDDNQWGYSYSADNQSTWSPYSGLPLYTNTGTTLSEKYVPSNETINFKIGAKSSSTQASGEYTNTINFIATAYPHPMSLADSYAYFNKQQAGGYYVMQDMEPGICATATENSELTVIDIRDNNTYTIAKLADGRCWMTQNLDLPGETALYSETSNVPEGYPESGEVPYYTLPASSTEGFDDNTKAFVYNSGNHTDSCTSSQPCYSYYSWIAATAGSGMGMTTANPNAPYDVCPTGWRLPTSSQITPLENHSELYNLLYAYGMKTGGISANNTTNPTGTTVYDNIKKGTLPNIVLSGQCYQGSCTNAGNWTHLWSSTVSSAYHQTYTASIASWTVSSANNDVQRYGFSVRCVANNS